MKYRMKVQIVDPQTPKGMTSGLFLDLTCSFSHDENQYGNGYWLVIKGEGFYPQYYDLRYDKSFDPGNKEKLLEDWARNYWTGKNGAWAIESIEIEKVNK